MTTAQSPASGAPRFSAQDIEIATELLLRPLDEPVTEIVSLTDEELMALEGIEHDPLTPTPWVDGTAPDREAQALVTAAAMRSMIARGIVTSSTVLDPRRYEDGSQEPARMVAVPELQGTVVLRRTSDAVLIAERRTERGTSYSYFYLFHVDGGIRVLWEAFDNAGFHLFFLLDGATLPEQLLAFTDPATGAGDADGSVEEVPAAEFGSSPTAARLAAARAVTTILVLRREDTAGPTAFTLFSTPDGLELMETAGEGEAAVQRVGALSRTRFTALVEDLIAATGPEGDAATGPQTDAATGPGGAPTQG